MPETIELPLTLPPELGPRAAVLAELRARVEAVEAEFAAERQRTGGHVCGRRAVLAQLWRDQPATLEPRRGLRPQVAARNKWARIESLMCNRAFAQAYATALEAWRAGIAAVFPPGTYWLRRFAHVVVAEA
jgi:capsule polysaccharide export protein KpsE/RkpR